MVEDGMEVVGAAATASAARAGDEQMPPVFEGNHNVEEQQL